MLEKKDLARREVHEEARKDTLDERGHDNEHVLHEWVPSHVALRRGHDDEVDGNDGRDDGRGQEPWDIDNEGNPEDDDNGAIDGHARQIRLATHAGKLDHVRDADKGEHRRVPAIHVGEPPAIDAPEECDERKGRRNGNSRKVEERKLHGEERQWGMRVGAFACAAYLGEQLGVVLDVSKVDGELVQLRQDPGTEKETQPSRAAKGRQEKRDGGGKEGKGT